MKSIRALWITGLGVLVTAFAFPAFSADAAMPTAEVWHIVLDNSSIHSTPAVLDWLEKHPRVHFHFTPKGASWINLVEAWFSILTCKSIRRGSFDTVRQLVRHIDHYLRHWNDDPIPFVWTKEPEDVIRKAVRH